MIDCFKCKKMGLFLGGVLFGTAGVKILAEAREINAQRCQEVFEDESREESPEHTSEYLKEDETASADTVTA